MTKKNRSCCHGSCDVQASSFKKELAASIVSCQISDFSLASIALCSLASGQNVQQLLSQMMRMLIGFSQTIYSNLREIAVLAVNCTIYFLVKWRSWPWLRRVA